MTRSEPETLVLRLQELVERRAALRTALEDALRGVLTAAEREDIERVLERIDIEIARVEGRLASLRASPGEGGTG